MQTPVSGSLPNSGGAVTKESEMYVNAVTRRNQTFAAFVTTLAAAVEITEDLRHQPDLYKPETVEIVDDAMTPISTDYPLLQGD